MNGRMSASVFARCLAMVLLGAIAGCRRPVVCAANEDLDPMSGACLPLCTDEVAPGIPCRSDGGTFEAGPRRDASNDSSADTGAMVDAGRCAAGEERCGADCVVLATSVAHCGRCGNACAAPSNGDAMCSGGACDFVCRRGFERVDGRCEVPQARLIAPMSASWVSSNRPTLHWDPRADVDGSVLEVCTARECSAGQVIATIDATGSSARVATALEPGSYFWRVRHKIGTVVASRASHTWGFYVGRGNAPRDTSYGGVFDFDGDGLADLAVSVPEWGDATRMRAGRVQIQVSNGPSAASFTSIYGAASNEALGTFVKNAGDVNGDGRSDLLVFSADPDVPVRVVHGVARSELLSARTNQQLTPPVRMSAFGFGMSGVGDIDRDGYGDVVVGACLEGGTAERSGAIYVFRGGPSGLQMPPQRIGGTRERGYLGERVAAAGDMNGDGYADVIVGAPNQLLSSSDGAGDGEVFVYSGGPGGLDAGRSVRILGPGNGSVFGLRLSLIGDANGDGYSDVAVAAMLDSRGGYREGGSVAVLMGGAVLPTMASTTVYGDNDAIRLGSAVTGGDVDGDGFDDLFATAPQSTAPPAMTRGEGQLFRGGPTGIRSAAIRVGPMSAGSGFGTDACCVGPGGRGGAVRCGVAEPGWLNVGIVTAVEWSSGALVNSGVLAASLAGDSRFGASIAGLL